MSNATQSASFSSASKIAELRQFVAQHDIVVTGNKSAKATYLQAIAQWENAKAVAAEAIENTIVLALEVEAEVGTQAVAVQVETVAVEYGKIIAKYLTSPEAKAFYRGMLRFTLAAGVLIFWSIQMVLMALWLVIEQVADDYQVVNRVVRTVAKAYVAVKYSRSMAQVRELVALYKPNAEVVAVALVTVLLLLVNGDRKMV